MTEKTSPPLSHPDGRLRELIKRLEKDAQAELDEAANWRRQNDGNRSEAHHRTLALVYHNIVRDLKDILLAAVPVQEAAPRNASTRTLAMLDELAAKPELRVKGWDTYDGDPLDDRAVAAARTFLGYPWAVVPCADGGVQLEIHAMGFDVEIEFSADGTIETAYAETVADQAASPGPVAGAVPAPQKVTRFEVIDECGRAFTRWNCDVELSYQDGGRTLKAFVTDSPPRIAEAHAKLSASRTPTTTTAEEGRRCQVCESTDTVLVPLCREHLLSSKR